MKQTATATTKTLSVVTGANGFVGRALLKELVGEGGDDPTTRKNNEIIGLVRPHRVESEQAYWGERVKIMPYDMLDGGASLEAAFGSSDTSSAERVLFHIASVFGPTKDPVCTAHTNVKGTLDAVRIAAKVNSKVVLTSSMAAVRGTGQIPRNQKYYTSQDWNTESKLDATNWGSCYQWSKKESEYQGRELAKQLNVPFVSLCPSFVFGPSDGDSTSFSLQLVKDWIQGRSPVQSRLCVDVRDVALAHVRAARMNEGRYIVSTERRVPSTELAGWFREVCEDTLLGDSTKIHADEKFQGGSIAIGEKEVDCIETLSNDLGVSVRPLKDTFQDMARMVLLDDSSPLPTDR